MARGTFREVNERHRIILTNFKKTGKIAGHNSQLVRSFGKTSHGTHRRDLKAIAKKDPLFALALHAKNPKQKAKVRRGVIYDHWVRTNQVPLFTHKLVKAFGKSRAVYKEDMKILGKRDPAFARARKTAAPEKAAVDKAVKAFTVDGLMQALSGLTQKKLIQRHKYAAVSRAMQGIGHACNPQTAKEIFHRFAKHADLKGIGGAKPVPVKEVIVKGSPPRRVPVEKKPAKIEPIFNYKTFRAIEQGEMDNVVKKLILKAKVLRGEAIEQLTPEETEFFRVHNDWDFAQYGKLIRFMDSFVEVKKRLFPELKD